jgi:hypothetical protein
MSERLKEWMSDGRKEEWVKDWTRRNEWVMEGKKNEWKIEGMNEWWKERRMSERLKELETEWMTGGMRDGRKEWTLSVLVNEFHVNSKCLQMTLLKLDS